MGTFPPEEKFLNLGDKSKERQTFHFEELLFNLALGFVNRPAQIDRKIESTFRRISEFFQVDRSTIFQLSSRTNILEVLFTYTSEGTQPVVEVDAQRNYPWCWRNLQAGKIIIISSLEEMPAEAGTDRLNMESAGIQSFIGIPVRIKGNFLYIFTLACLKRTCTWDPHLVNRIRLVCELMGNALHKKSTEGDLTKLKAEVDQYRIELLQRDRIGTINTLTASLSHEINQPLSAILSNAQAALHFLRRNPPDLEEVRQILTDIIADDKRASDVIHNIRSLLKKEDRQYEILDMNDLVNKVVSLVTSEAMLRQTLIAKDLLPDIPPVRGDPILLQQVLLNLVFNAMDAMEHTRSKPARITIETRTEEAGWIDIHVCDTGPGIAESIQKAIFKPFHTSKLKGLGIGLILCRAIIEAHEGSISAQNRPEGGARISLHLPAHQESSNVGLCT